jgi:hypothetical protein
MIKRREFIAGLGGAVAWPLAARAQQRALPVIGLVMNGSADPFAGSVAAFHKGTGYVEDLCHITADSTPVFCYRKRPRIFIPPH